MVVKALITVDLIEMVFSYLSEEVSLDPILVSGSLGFNC